jgi:acid phosphatase
MILGPQVMQALDDTLRGGGGGEAAGGGANVNTRARRGGPKPWLAMPQAPRGEYPSWARNAPRFADALVRATIARGVSEDVVPPVLRTLARLYRATCAVTGGAAAASTSSAVFGATPEDAEPFCFVSHGCWGGVKAPSQSRVAALLAAELGFAPHPAAPAGSAAQKKIPRSKFVISAGDNFYKAGVTSEWDARFNDTFYDLYVRPYAPAVPPPPTPTRDGAPFAPKSILEVPYLTLFGNHDYRGDFMAQVRHSFLSGTTNWAFPYAYYAVPLPAYSLMLVVLDCPLLERCTVNVVGSLRCWDGDAQMRFLEDTLKGGSSAGFAHQVVTCHYPMYANGPHVNAPWLQKAVGGMMEKYGARLYINADNHYMQVSMRRGVVTSGGDRGGASAADAGGGDDGRNIWYVNSGGGAGFAPHTRSARNYALSPHSVFERIGYGVFRHCVLPPVRVRGGTATRHVLQTEAISVDDGSVVHAFNITSVVAQLRPVEGRAQNVGGEGDLRPQPPPSGNRDGVVPPPPNTREVAGDVSTDDDIDKRLSPSFSVVERRPYEQEDPRLTLDGGGGYAMPVALLVAAVALVYVASRVRRRVPAPLLTTPVVTRMVRSDRV